MNKLKKVQKEEFSAAFQKLYYHTKACIYANGAYFEIKKSSVSLICKKISHKFLDRTVYVHSRVQHY